MTVSRLETLQRFLDEDPADPFNHYALALEFITLQRFEDAILKFEVAIGLDNQYVPAYHQLGLLLGQLDRRDEAVRRLQEGIRIASLVGDTHAGLEMQEAIDDLGDE